MAGLGAAVLLTASLGALGQGLPSGNLTGRVSYEGQGLPGVTITATSPNLQGARTVTSSSNGDYSLVKLPPGEYAITYAISGFQNVSRTVNLGAAQTVTLDTTLSMTGIVASTEVVGRGEQISDNASQTTTYTSELLNKLPVARTLASAVNLTPGVTANGPNGAFTISGAQSFDNNILVNGVNIQDNVRGTPFNLFIEDAIQETSTSTSAISAEYGRFQGGVVNTITKSGGNVFSGSFRTTLNNDAWQARTAFNEDRIQSLSPVYEATLGGPIWKDRVWFFGAGRIPKVLSAASTTSAPASVPFTATNDEKRYEGKLTVTPFDNHTVTGSYIRIDQTQGNYGFASLPFYDLESVYDRELPQELMTGNYSGVLSNNFSVEAQYAKRKFTFKNAGSQFDDLIRGTVLHDQTQGGFYNSPIFCAVCPGADEKRDSEDILLKGTYFLSSKTLGSHTIAAGFDQFTGQHFSNNYQSGSSYFINATDAIFANGDIFPVVDSSTYLGFYPIPRLAQPSEARTYSGYVNDSWKLNNNFAFNLGVRWDKNRAKDANGAITADDTNLSPRLAATFDPTGNGTLRFNVSYAKYVGAIQDNQVGAAASFGAPAAYYYGYSGPSINTDPNGTLLTRAQVIQQIFAWYGITSPNQFPTQHADDLFGASVPGVNTQIRGGLRSPNTDEFTVGVASTLGSRVSFRLDGIYRNAHDFYSTRTDLSTGQITDELQNVYDIGIVENVNSPLQRKYYGLNVQFAVRPFESLSVGGNWTWSHAYGNFLGETAGSGPVQSNVLEYPEYKEQRWNNPSGDLLQDQRHKVRLYATYDLPVPRSVGTIGFSVLQQYDTGTPYGALGQVNAEAFVTNPGYATPPSGSSGAPAYYYTARDAFRTDNIARTDLALNFAHQFGPLEIFLQPQVLNVFNNQGLVAVNTTVLSSVNASDQYSSFNPFTETPVEGVNWAKGPLFGQARTGLDYQLPRTVRVSMGIRF
ncbi:MAG: TonB-dependent receptor [Thermoanaerobaculia bacterium]